jgi:hypothetical protein
MACDNLISADVVTADGRLLVASETENSDLFWALRGGGGNFGVVTAFEYRLYAVGPVLAGLVVHPFAQAKEVLQFYRDFSITTHAALTTYAVPMTSPDGDKVVAIGVCYDGPMAEGERLIAPVRRFGPPLADHIRPMAYTELQSMFDGALPPGRQYYVKAHFLREIRDEAIDVVVDSFARVPSPLSLPFFQQTGGAMQRGHTAYAHPPTATPCTTWSSSPSGWTLGSRRVMCAGSGSCGRPCSPMPPVASMSTTSVRRPTMARIRSGRHTAPTTSGWRS